MKHKTCGGEILPDFDRTCPFRGYNVPLYFCSKCGDEIIGDAQIDLGGFEQYLPKQEEQPNG